MDGIIKNFRRGKRNVYNRQLVVELTGVDSKEKAYAMVGSKVGWESPAGKPFTGTITSAHGNSGAMKVQFQKGLPGQCIGTKVEITKSGEKPKITTKKPAQAPKKAQVEEKK